jgi:amino acid adenylation domain-containing protein/non-ribosomal peptide synthase protein (TIGR01720 family)
MTQISKKLSNLTPEQLELLRKKLKKKNTAPANNTIVPRQNKNNFPLSSAQERLWFFDQLAPNNAFYNITSAIHINGEFDPIIFAKSLNKVIARHEVLRSFYLTENGAPLQKIAANLTIDIPLIDYCNKATETIDTLLLTEIENDATRPFKLDEAPLIRAKIIKLSDQQHVLILTMHHIIADGWSSPILLNETGKFYDAFLNTKPDQLEPLKLQYADYASWQKEQGESEKQKKQLDYWKDKLAGMPDILELPLDKKRPAEQTFNGAHYHFNLGKNLSEKIKRFSKEQGSTLFITLISAYQVLLYRYSGQQDFGIGLPIANRNKKEIESLVGFFVNTLVLRSQIDPDLSFAQILQQVKSNLLEAYDNQDIPFERLVETILPNRDLSHSPFFQTMFELQGDAMGSLAFGDVKLEAVPFENHTSKFDLLMMMEEGADEISASLEYNTDIFSAETIQHLCTHFSILLESITANPQRAISQLAIMDADESKKIVQQWNDSSKDYPQYDSLMSRFEEQVRKTPNAPALTFKSETITYQELNTRANRLANHLVERGLKNDELVGLFMERSFELVIAMYAIQKAGAAYLPLDPEYPGDRIKFMIDDTNLRSILTLTHLEKIIPENQADVIAIDRAEPTLLSAPDSNPSLKTKSNRLAAYMIFTSGSTGNPKGVLIEHKAILNRLFWMQEVFELGRQDTVLQKTPFSFDVSVWEFFWPLLFGSRMVIAESDGHKDTAYLCKLIQDENITTLHFVPPMLQVFIEDPAFPKCTSLKRVICSGEALGVDLQNRFFERHSAQLHNLYGPTEAAVDVTHWVCKKEDTLHSVPIGKTIANTQIYILDRLLNPVPVGVPGELFIGGIQLARAYHNRPDLTAEKFIPDPFSQEEGSRLYRTGDLVRFLNDGNIEFLGRIDHQIKLRGFRIELGEIEAAVSKITLKMGVKDTLVLAQKTSAGDLTLVAYLVCKNLPDSNRLKNELGRMLPEYMVPDHFIAINSFPLTPNGKINRKALPLPDGEHSKAKKMYVAPSNNLEKFLVETIEDILGVEKVGVLDNFFELGGNSLKAATLINRLQEKVQKSLHIGMIFKAPVIEDLATYAEEYFAEDVLREAGSIESNKSNKMHKRAVDSAAKINDKDILKLREIIDPLREPDPKYKSDKKNKKALFILSPPRSGSTLLRIMLAGNKQLFSPPELDLLAFNTIRERDKTFRDVGLNIWLEATQRALMELNNCSVNDAVKMMNAYEKQDISSKQFYAEMQALLGDRILVDKTPSYPLDLNILNRAENDFEDAVYIHLKRHPYAMVYSFIEAELDQNFFRYKHPFTRRQLAELVWIVSHQNINSFLDSIPAHRKTSLHFENVLVNPGEEMRRLCTFLDIPFEEEMLEPYKGDKMTSGANSHSQMVGDFKFYLHSGINSEVANKWRRSHQVDFLSDEAWEIAEQFGYPVEKHITGKPIDAALLKINAIDRNKELPLSFAQERLWFIDQLEPGTPQYNIPGGIRLKGDFDASLFQKCLDYSVQRHETLRTIFTTDTDGKSKLTILPECKVKLEIIDFSHLDNKAQNKTLNDFAKNEASKSFNLSEGPLLRTHLIKTGPNSYIFTIVMHHIISDGWSVNLFFREIVENYLACSQGRELALPALPIQYVDYAAWQRDWLTGKKLDKQLDYWKNKLNNSAPLLELPTDKPRAATQTFSGNTWVFKLPAELTNKIKELGYKNNSTVFMVLVAAFKILLYRYSNQNDISIGTPIAGRTRNEVEQLIGFFVNTLVMRDLLYASHTFKHVLNNVSTTATEAFDHQDIPFEKLVDAIEPNRNLSYPPLFQVMFAMQSSDFEVINIPGIEVAPFNLDSGTSKFDMTMTMVEVFGELRGQLEYNSDLFELETIKRFIDHFKFLLQQIIESPETTLDSFILMPESEKQIILSDWNATQKDYDAPQPLMYFFEEATATYSQNTALLFNGEQLSYNDLNKRVNQLAHFLIKKGVKKDSFIGLYMERSFELVIGMYAILKAGAAYVPLDPEYPEDRRIYMIEDSRAEIILSTSKISSTLKSFRTEIINIDLLNDELSQFPENNPPQSPDIDNAAYMIYTSGSTGKPKGVVISHRAIHNRLCWMQETFNIDTSDRVLQKTPYSFDVSVWEFFWPLRHGSTLVLAKAGGHKDPSYLQQFIIDHSITTLHFVPAMLQLFMDNADVTMCKSLKRVICSGEALSTELQNRFLEKSSAGLHNLYGPTEAAVDVTYWQCRPNEKRISTPIGKAIANTQIYVLDKKMNLQPKGIPGELYIGGVQVARNYHNRPALTAEKFVPDPFSDKSGARLYRTGDLVRFIENGNIEFLGRIDHQVKLHGLRIELGEIENALRENTYIDDSIVIVHEDKKGEKRLAAYILTSDKEKIPVAGLRAQLAQQLPEYMVPSFFTFMDAFPLSPSGKVDRKKLPEPEIKREDIGSDFQEARNEKEKTLLEIWHSILNVKKIGINDNFFELGGDSILSIQVIARAKQAGLSLLPKQLFENPTIAGLAAVAGSAPIIHAEQGLVEGEQKLSAIQNWFFEQEFINPNHWNQSSMFEISEKLNPAILEETLKILIDHHDALRTQFTVEEKAWKAEVLNQVSLAPFKHYNLVKMPTLEADGFIEEKANTLQASIDLEKPPLIRMAYFSLADGKTDKLFIAIHHLVVDGFSWRIIMEDIQHIYTQLVKKEPVRLAPKTTSFKYWGDKICTYAQTDEIINEVNYWSGLSIGDKQVLPFDKPNGTNIEKLEKTISFKLVEKDTNALLQEIPAVYNTQINEALLSALLIAFGRWTGKKQLLLYLEGHGREALFPDVDVSRTVGWFTTLYPVFLDASEQIDTGETLKYVKENLREIPANGLGYGLLKHLSKFDESKGLDKKMGTIDIVFNYLGQFSTHADKDTGFKMVENLSGYERDLNGERMAVLDISGAVIDNKLRINIKYSDDMFFESTINDLCTNYKDSLHKLIEHCKEPASGGYTPSDFMDSGLDQEDLDDLLDDLE